MRAILDLPLLLLVIKIVIVHGSSLTKATKSTPRLSTTEKPDLDIIKEGDNFEAAQTQTEPHPTNSSCCTKPFFVSVPGLITISDDIPVSTVIGRVQAVDPDSKKQRKIVYRYDKDENDTFSVDEDTGVIRTRARLDAAPLPEINVTTYMIMVWAEFQNDTSNLDDDDEMTGGPGVEAAIMEGKSEFFLVWIRALHGNFLGLLHETEPDPIETDCVTITVVESTWNPVFWLQIALGIFDILGGTIVITTIFLCIYNEKKRRSFALHPPTCVQVAGNEKSSK